MAIGSFSNQVSANKSQQEQRLTRTQRQSNIFNQNIWKREANRLSTDVFVDKVVDETYYEKIPNRYVLRGQIAKEWYLLTPKQREELIKNTAPTNFTLFQRTRQVTVPFTFDDYTKEYANLNPNVKQFFLSPATITQTNLSKLESNRTVVDNKIRSWENKLLGIQKDLENYRIWWEKQSETYKQNNRKRYIDQLTKYEDNIDLLNNQLNELRTSKNKIDEGYDPNDIINNAEDVAREERKSKIERRNASLEFTNTLKYNGSDQEIIKRQNELINSFSYLGLNKNNVNYSTYSNAIEQYNQKAKYSNDIFTWNKNVGFENLPDFAKNILNPSAMEFQRRNPNEKLLFDKNGNVIGVESEALQKTLPLNEYNKMANVKGKTPDEIYKEWQMQQAGKPIYLDFKEQNGQLYSTKANQYENKGFFSGTKEKYNKFIESSGDIKLNLVGVGALNSNNNVVKPIAIKDILDPVSDVLSKNIEQVSNDIVNLTPNKKSIDEKYQQEYQTRFEQEYMKKMIYGEITFEKASEEFAKSDTAKTIQSKYSQAIDKDTENFSRKDKWIYGTRLSGLGLAKGLVDIFPRKRGDLLVKGTLLYTGAVATKSIPPIVNLGITGGFFAQGTYKAFSPKSTPSEAGAGLITSIITGASLGYAGYRYLRSPVIKTIDIPKPKKDLQTTTIGRDINVESNGRSFNKVMLGEQKLSQFSVGGRRTIVTSKWRDLMNKYLGTDIPNIYEGIPTEQQAIYGTDVFRGGRYKLTQSGYEKALNKLENYGYTKYQATKTLRYYAPKTVETWLKSGELNVYNDISASGRFVYDIKKPVIDLGDGIKTRGGKTVREYYDVERKVIDVNDKQLMIELKSKLSVYLDSGKATKIKDIGFYSSVSRAKSSDLIKGSEFLKDVDGLGIYKKNSLYKNLYSATRDTYSITATPKRKYTDIEIIGDRKNLRRGKTTLFQYDINLDDTSFIGSRSNIDRQIERITGQKTNIKLSSNVKSNVANIINDQRLSGLTDQLKATVKTDQVVFPKQNNLPSLKTNTLNALSYNLAVGSSLQLKQKNEYKLAPSLKNQLKSFDSLRLETIQSDLLKQSLKQNGGGGTRIANIPKLQLNPIEPKLDTIKINPPVRFIPKFVIFGSDSELKKKIKSKNRKKIPTNLGLLPDFTSRALGLEPKEFGSVKDALKEINKIQTGFGIRRGGRFKF